MILVWFLFTVEALATDNKYHRQRRLGSYDSYEWQQTVDPVSLPAGNATSTPAWWLSMKTREPSETATAPSRADKRTSVYSPVENVTLTLDQVKDLAKDVDGLDYIIEEQSVHVFNDSIPELHKLVRQWLMELVNKTKMDTNFTMPEIAWWVDPKRPSNPDFEPGNENVPHPKTQRNLQNQYRTPPSLHRPHVLQDRSPGSKYNPEHSAPSRFERPSGFEGRNPANEGIAGYRERLPLTQSPPGLNGRPSEAGRPAQYSDERDLPPERPGLNDYQEDQYRSQPYPPGPEEVPPNFQEYPAGSQRMPPGSQGFPPSSQGFQPGSDGLPPGGYKRYPLGPQEVRSGSQPYPPGPQEVPPDYQEYPAKPQRLPPGTENFKPGSGGLPPGVYKGYPPMGSQEARFGSQPYPPRPQDVPPDYQVYPPGSQRLPPVSQRLPPGGYERYPLGPQRAQSGSQLYPPGLQKVPPNYPAGSQGFPPGSRGIKPSSQGIQPDYEQLALGPQEASSGSNLQLPMGSHKFLPSSQGYPPGSQGFLQGRQMMLTSPVVPSPSPAEPEVSIMDVPVPAEYRDMLANYADVMENVDQRPHMVNDLANSMILFGMTSTTTSTMHPLVSALHQDVLSSRSGFFSTFASKLLELLATKDKDAAGRLLIANDMNLNSQETEASLRFLGMPLQPALLKAAQVLSAMAPDLVQSYATIAHQALKQRPMLPHKVDGILTALDSMYLAQEGKALFASLTLFEAYPRNNLTSRPVMRAVIEAVFAPFFRMQGTDRLASVLRQMNDFVTEYYPSRRSYPREYHLRNATDKKKSKTKAISYYAKITTTTSQRNKGKETRKIIGGNANKPSKRKKDQKYKSVTDETKNGKPILLNAMKVNPIAKRIDTRTTADKKTKSENIATRSGNKLKIKGLSIETDRDFTIKKRKYKTDDFKKHLKHKIRKHLKNKHRDLFENLKNKHRKAKALAEQQRHSKRRDHYYETLLKNKYRHEDKPDTNSETTKHTDRSYQKRFNVVDITAVDRTFIKNNDASSGRKIKAITDSSQLKTNKAENIKHSKYLSKYKPKNKQGFDKFNKSKIGIEDSSSNDEREMKFNLQDTLRHGDRPFIERRNYRSIDRKILHELSSYSDEEGILKNNIYKVFGYTQGRILEEKKKEGASVR